MTIAIGLCPPAKSPNSAPSKPSLFQVLYRLTNFSGKFLMNGADDMMTSCCFTTL
jgi:hypothetical protein